MSKKLMETFQALYAATIAARKAEVSVHRYWRMRFCSAACMNAYQQRLSPDTQQKIYEIDGYRPLRKAA